MCSQFFYIKNYNNDKQVFIFIFCFYFSKISRLNIQLSSTFYLFSIFDTRYWVDALKTKYKEKNLKTEKLVAHTVRLSYCNSAYTNWKKLYFCLFFNNIAWKWTITKKHQFVLLLYAYYIPLNFTKNVLFRCNDDL